MAEDHLAGASRYGPYSRTLAEIHAEQGRIRAASARQRTRAAGMRDEALELRAQRRPVRWSRTSIDHQAHGRLRDERRA